MSKDIEKENLILNYIKDHPAQGPGRIADQLRQQGIKTSEIGKIRKCKHHLKLIRFVIINYFFHSRKSVRYFPYRNVNPMYKKNAKNHKFIILFITIFALPFVLPSIAHEEFKDIEIFKEIPYAEIKGANSNLTHLDIYTPVIGENCPVLIFVHGGTWIQGDKGDLNYKAKTFTNAGWILVSVNYRLSPEVMHPVHTQDVAKAIAWVYHNISDYRGDAQYIFVMGYSAGAHLAALVATDEHYLEEEGIGLKVLKGIILLESAYYDIPKRLASEPYNSTIHQMIFGNDPELWYEASPINHVAEDKDIPPFLLIHTELYERHYFQALALVKALQNSGIYAQLYYAEDKDHVSLNNDLGKFGDNTTEIILQFLTNILHNY